jgi:WD40 repeat protein/serine/threonine protein kinase
MSETGSGREPLDQLAEEFAQRCRRGERPSLTEYAQRYPELADEIRELFPALVEMEELRPEQTTGAGIDLVAGSSIPRQLGDYRILREVGRGGMGIVYEAVQESLGRHVALKVLPLHSLLQPTCRERFHREAHAAARLHHTNIVPVFAVGEHEGLLYYSMQYIHGQGLDIVLQEVKRLRVRTASSPPGESTNASVLATSAAQGLLTGQFFAADTQVAQPRAASRLAQVQNQSGNTSVLPDVSSELGAGSDARYYQSVARVGAQVASALAYAHRQGVLHRDIKPSNLLLDTQGTVWITDFGLAKEAGADDLTGTGDVVGTLRYVAPERFRGQNDPRSDIYSLGLTLYELLALRPAFAATERAQLMEQILHHEPTRPRLVDGRIPRDLELISLKALARNPEDRYATAQELGDDLNRFLLNEPIRARRPTLWQRLRKWAWRHQGVVVSLAGSALVLLVGTIVALAVSNAAITQEREETKKALQAKDEALSSEKEALWAKGQALEREQQLSYFYRIGLADHAWSNGNIARVEELLDDCPTRLRHFEWYYLKRLCHADLLTLRLEGPTAPASVAFSPDSSRVAAIGKERVVIWDLRTGQETVRCAHPGSIDCLAWSPDGLKLASGGRDRTIRLWDSRSGALLGTIEGKVRQFMAVAFSPDGRYLAFRDHANIRVWELAVAQEVCHIADHLQVGLAFSPDSRWLASGTTQGVKVWEAKTGRTVCTFPQTGSHVQSLAFSPDGRWLASGHGDAAVRLWSVQSGRQESLWVVHQSSVTSVTFSPDCKRLASGSNDRTVRSWDVETGANQLTFRGHTTTVESVAFSPDGKRLASAGFDRTVKVWDATSHQEGRALWWARDALLSPDGRHLLVVPDLATLKLFDAFTCTERCALTERRTLKAGACLDPRFSSDGRFFAAVCDSECVKVWDVRTCQEVATGVVEILGRFDLSADGQRLVTLMANRKGYRVLDVPTERELFTLTDPAFNDPRGRLLVDLPRFSPDGERLAWRPTRSTLSLVDAHSGEELRRLEDPALAAGNPHILFSLDGRLLAAARQDDTVGLWETATGREVATGGHKGTPLAFSPDGKRLLVQGEAGSFRALRLWDTATGTEILELRDCPGLAQAAFLRDGQGLIGRCWDGSVRFWDATPPGEQPPWAAPIVKGP